MKKFIVVSDSHHYNKYLNAIFANHPDIPSVLHCGDIQDKMETVECDDFTIVTGNTDFEDFADYRVLEIENVKLIMTHGHLFDIEDSFEDYYQKAKEEGCVLALYGHTHNPMYFLYEDVYFLNPGSVSFPRGGRVTVPTYAILTIDDGKFECHYYHAKTFELIDHLVIDTQQEIKRKQPIVQKPKPEKKAKEPSEKKPGLFKRLFGNK